MSAIRTGSPALLKRVENWAANNVGHAEVSTLGADEIGKAAADLGVSKSEILGIRDALVASASASAERSARGSARDREASRPVSVGHNGQRLDTSPMFARFAPVMPQRVAAAGRPADGPAPLVELKPAFRSFATAVEADVPMGPIGGVNVQKAEQERFVGARNKYLHASAFTTLDVQFGKLDASKFNALSDAFGGKSDVTFDPNREYTAVDFLPPMLQALVNQDLQPPAPVELPNGETLDDDDGFLLGGGEARSLDLTANCHATAWEAMRAFQTDSGATSFDLFMGDATVLDGLVNDETFATLQRDVSSTKDMDLAAMKPGDAVIFYDDAGFNPLHTAVYVGGGMFFEKPDTESTDTDAPYRLGTLDSISTPVADFTGQPLKMRAVRPKQPVKSGREAFATSFSKQLDDYTQQQGRPLGVGVVDVLELRMGGGVMGAALSAAVTVGLDRDDAGRGKLAAP